MKKVIIGLAALALASSLQAATVAWSAKNDGAKTYAYSTVYMVLASDYSDAIAALNAGGTSIAETMASYNTQDAVVQLGSKGAGTGSKSDAASTDGSYYWILVNTTSSGQSIADGLNYYATEAISYDTLKTAGAVAEGSGVPENFILIDSSKNLFSGASGVVGAPEPTSGILMLIGASLLALRRKQK